MDVRALVQKITSECEYEQGGLKISLERENEQGIPNPQNGKSSGSKWYLLALTQYYEETERLLGKTNFNNGRELYDWLDERRQHVHDYLERLQSPPQPIGQVFQEINTGQIWAFEHIHRELIGWLAEANQVS